MAASFRRRLWLLSLIPAAAAAVALLAWSPVRGQPSVSWLCSCSGLWAPRTSFD